MLLTTDRVMKAKFSQESAGEKTDKLTDTAIHSVCQDTHTHTNPPACMSVHTHIHTNTHRGIKDSIELFKGGFCQAAVSEWSPSD